MLRAFNAKNRERYPAGVLEYGFKALTAMLWSLKPENSVRLRVKPLEMRR